jgi:CBS domain-containing protein
MRCMEIMKRGVACARSTSTLVEAARLMRHTGANFLPVCDEAGAFVGTLTEHDIVVRACANDLALAKTKVGVVMTREELCCREDFHVHAAERLMSRFRRSRLAVVDRRRRLVGVIYLADIARAEQGGLKAARAARKAAPRDAAPKAELSMQLEVHTPA